MFLWVFLEISRGHVLFSPLGEETTMHVFHSRKKTRQLIWSGGNEETQPKPDSAPAFQVVLDRAVKAIIKSNTLQAFGLVYMEAESKNNIKMDEFVKKESRIQVSLVEKMNSPFLSLGTGHKFSFP